MMCYSWVSFNIKPLSLIRHQTIANSFRNLNINTTNLQPHVKNLWIIPFSFTPEAWLKSYFKNKCEGFSRVSKHLKTIKALVCNLVLSSVFLYLPWKPQWNSCTHFWNSTSKLQFSLLFSNSLTYFLIKYGFQELFSFYFRYGGSKKETSS